MVKHNTSLDIFFDEKGLTTTAANNAANMAKEHLRLTEAELENICLVNEGVSLISAESPTDIKVLRTGCDNDYLDGIEQKLKRIAGLKSLIAWLREAIRAKDMLMDELNIWTIQSFAEAKGMDMPTDMETKHPLCESDVIGMWSVKERNRYYTLEAFCATIGKYIQPDGSFARARAEYQRRLTDKAEVQGDGRDMVIYRYDPSVSEEKLEKTYFDLQQTYRNYSAEFNGMRHKVLKAVEESDIECKRENALVRAEYNNAFQRIQNAFVLWLAEEKKRIGELKIIIPNDLKDTYDEVMGNDLF